VPVKLAMADVLLDALRDDSGVMLFGELALTTGIPTAAQAVKIRAALEQLLAEGLVTRCPEVGADCWRALPSANGRAVPELVVPAGGRRLSPDQSAALNGIIRRHYGVGGLAAVMPRIRGVRPDSVRKRAWRLGVRAP